MNVAIVQTIMGSRPSEMMNESTHQLCVVLNKSACEAFSWDFINDDKVCTVNTSGDFFQYIQESTLKWKIYDIVLLLGHNIFLKDIFKCAEGIQTFFKFNSRLLVVCSCDSQWPEAIGWRPRGAIIEELLTSVKKMNFAPGDLESKIPSALVRISDATDAASLISTAITRLSFSVSAEVTLATKNICAALAFQDTIPDLELSNSPPPRKYNPANKSTPEKLIAQEFMARLFTYERVGFDSRELSFLPDGTVGIGTAGEERFWDVEMIDGSNPIFSLSSKYSLTCEFSRNHCGIWVGQWLNFERMLVTLYPVCGEKTVDNQALFIRNEHSISRYKVVSEVVGFDLNVQYDLNISVLVHCKDGYVDRAYSFLKHGLRNIGKNRIHVLIIASLNDREHFADLRQFAPDRADLSFLEMGSHLPVPKINGHYLWLLKSKLKARWYMRVDDDSITDITALLNHVDKSFFGQPIHLMTSPCEKEIGGPLFQIFAERNGSILKHYLHEYESSISSAESFKMLSLNKIAIDFLTTTAQYIDSPGDRALAFAMQLAGVSMAPNPKTTKDYDSNFSLIGGRYYHIHYIDWNNLELQEFLSFYEYGQHSKITYGDLLWFIGPPLIWRVAMELVHSVVMFESNAMGKNCTSNEILTWKFVGGGFHVIRRGVVIAIFETLIFHCNNRILVGRELPSDNCVYLSNQFSSRP